MRTLVAAFVLCCSAFAQIAVTNAAGGRVSPGVAAGSFASLYGSFAGASKDQAASTPLPTTLGGVSVTIGGVTAPMHYADSNQINIQVPFGVTAGLQDIVVRTPSTTISGKVKIVSAAPGIFTQDAATPPKGAILNQDYSANTQDNPARRGDVIQIFATGPGRLSATVADGAASPSSPLALTVSQPQVFLGGVPAAVQFSGMAPGLVGLWQVNAVIPERGFLNGRVPVTIFMDGVDSNEVAVFVAP